MVWRIIKIKDINQINLVVFGNKNWIKWWKKMKLINLLKKRELEKEILIPSNLNMAYIDIKNKNWSEVIRHCGKVLYVDPDNIKARYRKCLALINQGELEKADEELIRRWNWRKSWIRRIRRIIWK